MADPHEVLGVPAGASNAEVHAAYRRHVAQHHPDRGGDVSRFLAGQDAYRKLVAKRDRDPNVVLQFHQHRSALGALRRTVKATALRIVGRPEPPPRVQ